MPYNQNIFNIDLEKLAHWMIPVRWRADGVVAWVKATAATWSDLYNRFAIYRKLVTYNLFITPQVCYLEKALNDKYDPIQRRIFIEDGAENEPVYLFIRDEQKPVYLYARSEEKPVYLIQRAESAEYGVDFTVHVPAGLTFNMAEMRTYVTVYKLATKTFSIVLF